MTQNLNELLKWFPSGTAEGEKAILERVFVYVAQFADVMAPPSGNPYLLIGDKGSGKSAIIDFALRVLAQQQIPSVLLTPFDIETADIGEGSSTGDMSRFFYRKLMSTIAAKLTEEDTGWDNADLSTLYHEAVDKGERSPDFAGRMGKFLSDIAKPLVKVDLNSAFPHLTRVTRDELERAIGRSLNTKSFYLFLDDTDQIANPERPGHLNRIWALLLAIRRLTSKIPEVRSVISLRSEVWARLQVDPSGQRDQTDHFKNLCITLRTDRAHVANIVDRRLSLAAHAVGRPSDLYGPFFEGPGARAPFSQDFRSWRDLIAVRSRERPRDAIQLVNGLAKRAISDQKPLIDESTFQAVMPTFSEQVAVQFAQEVVLECPRALDILRTFSGADYDQGSFTLTSEATLNHFKRAFSKFGIILYGTPLDQRNEADAFAVWRFFFVCGVLNARVSDSTQRDGYRHLDPESDPTLVSKARWNDLQATLWEVNTAYRDYLITLENEARQRTGLPVKARAKPRNRRP